ncbi:unnamed protein product [Prunus brigantina]
MFKKDLNDSSNLLSSWVGEGDCCNWTGVVCHNLTGHVRELRLGTYYLSGKLNPSLLNLKNLNYLDLSKNSFDGSQIPDFFGSLTSLRYLNLSQADFQGVIPHQLGNLSSLHYLDLHGNYFEVNNLQWISGLSLLQFLDMHGVNLSKASDRLQETNMLPSLRNSINSTIPTWLYSFSHLEYLILSDNYLHADISSSIGNLTALVNLDFNHNQLGGKIPNSLKNLCNQLESLSLSYNNLSGELTDELGNFKNLAVLDLSSNSISGPIPPSIGSLSSLKLLNISNNSLKGDVSEVHFTNLTRLEELHATDNSLTLKTSRGWLPPFQLFMLHLNSWHLGPELPRWLQSQTRLEDLSISNTSISGTIPIWFWNFSSLAIVDLSHNQLHGQVPRIVTAPSAMVDLSYNNFSGSLPLVSSTVAELDLSNSLFSGSIFHFFCDRTDELKELTILYLGDNHLTGEIPDCWINWKNLIVVGLQSNHLTGNIPSSIGDLIFLQELLLPNNHLSGELPLSLQKCKNLLLVDLANNNFTGSIPTWIGKSLSQLMVLIFYSNKLHGDIPNELCNLLSLRILDLSFNNFVGAIPICFGKFRAMSSAKFESRESSFSFRFKHGFYGKYIDNYMAGPENLGLVNSLDLSSNNLSGEIPEELTSLIGLVLLNLSNNLLTGRIPSKIGDMRNLEELDLSMNRLSGEISRSMVELNFLAYLNLSYNNLTGQIPIEYFDESSYFGNKLCGPPVKEKCGRNVAIEKHGGSHTIEKQGGSHTIEKHGGSHRIEHNWLYMGMGLALFFVVNNGSLVFNLQKVWLVVITRVISNHLQDSSNQLMSWDGEGDCCNWAGVVCHNLTGHVRELRLGNYYLAGKLNPSLLNLKNLDYLDLSNNDFEGRQIPNFFGSLASLRHLDLSQADFQGIIPPQLGNLSNLRYLDLHDNYFEVKNLQWISDLSLLQHLDMSGINLREAGDWLLGTNILPSLLEYLNMSNCGLNQIPGVAISFVQRFAWRNFKLHWKLDKHFDGS